MLLFKFHLQWYIKLLNYHWITQSFDIWISHNNCIRLNEMIPNLFKCSYIVFKFDIWKWKYNCIRLTETYLKTTWSFSPNHFTWTRKGTCYCALSCQFKKGIAIIIILNNKIWNYILTYIYGSLQSTLWINAENTISIYYIYIYGIHSQGTLFNGHSN